MNQTLNINPSTESKVSTASTETMKCSLSKQLSGRCPGRPGDRPLLRPPIKDNESQIREPRRNTFDAVDDLDKHFGEAAPTSIKKSSCPRRSSTPRILEKNHHKSAGVQDFLQKLALGQGQKSIAWNSTTTSKKHVSRTTASSRACSSSEMAKLLFAAVFERSKYQLEAGPAPTKTSKASNKAIAGSSKNAHSKTIKTDLKRIEGGQHNNAHQDDFMKKVSSLVLGEEKSREPSPSAKITKTKTPTSPTALKKIIKKPQDKRSKQTDHDMTRPKLRFADTDEVCGTITSDNFIQNDVKLPTKVRNRNAVITDMVISFSSNTDDANAIADSVLKHQNDKNGEKSNANSRRMSTALVQFDLHQDKTTQFTTNTPSNDNIVSNPEDESDCFSLITIDQSIQSSKGCGLPSRTSLMYPRGDIRDRKALFDALATTKRGKGRVSIFGEQQQQQQQQLPEEGKEEEEQNHENKKNPKSFRRCASSIVLSEQEKAHSSSTNEVRKFARSFSMEVIPLDSEIAQSAYISKISSILYA